jgi:hypothetical protein
LTVGFVAAAFPLWRESRKMDMKKILLHRLWLADAPCKTERATQSGCFIRRAGVIAPAKDHCVGTEPSRKASLGDRLCRFRSDQISSGFRLATSGETQAQSIA